MNEHDETAKLFPTPLTSMPSPASTPGSFEEAEKKVEKLEAESIVGLARRTRVAEVEATFQKAEAAKVAAETERIKAEREKKMAEHQQDTEQGFPAGIKDLPNVQEAIRTLTPIFGEARAKAMVYQGVTQNWMPGAQTQEDPMANFGRSVLQPIANKLGTTLAEQIVGGQPPAQPAAAPAQPVPLTAKDILIEKTAEIEALGKLMSTALTQRDTLLGAQANPAVTPTEKHEIGGFIKGLDDYIKVTEMQRNYDIQLLSIQEESRERWAKYEDEKEERKKKGEQIDEGLGLAKQALPTAVAAAQALVISRGGAPGKSKASQERVQVEDIFTCPQCQTDNVVPLNTKDIACKQCKTKLEIADE